ncbi:hypothetical protein EXN66_Car016932 [Channa argus]|uniref:Uncharacterized protein n=1 Tax=Channa argus TaxID=215402 RepID=A0A6G1QFM9_CHAAH|nr:hypothetical protein EXN66_Car016932 [Channa argus]
MMTCLRLLSLHSPGSWGQMIGGQLERWPLSLGDVSNCFYQLPQLQEINIFSK